MIKDATLSDSKQIIELEKKYYEGYSISEGVLAK